MADTKNIFSVFCQQHSAKAKAAKTTQNNKTKE
jgi:hypothetical protein